VTPLIAGCYGSNIKVESHGNLESLWMGIRKKKPDLDQYNDIGPFTISKNQYFKHFEELSELP